MFQNQNSTDQRLLLDTQVILPEDGAIQADYVRSAAFDWYLLWQNRKLIVVEWINEVHIQS